MGTVYFGLAGEGRGHAARAVTLIEHLRTAHQIVVLTFGQALDMLTPLYSNTEVTVRKIDGLHLAYGMLGRMSPTMTAMRGAVYAASLERRAKALAAQLTAEQVSLVVSDFEPLTLRAAQRAGVPALSLDHPRFLQVCSFDDLPWHARLKIWGMASIIRRIYGKPEHMVVSGFHLTVLRKEYEHAVTTGVLIRPELLALTPTSGDHLVAYFRRQVSERVLHALAQSGHRVLVYGLGAAKPRGAVEFRPIQESAFLAALASCRAVISTCGNQLIGEAFHLHKPVLAFPEPGNFEQQINGYLLNRSKGGMCVDQRQFTAECVTEFLARLEEFRRHLSTQQRAGNFQVKAYVDSLLNGTRLVRAGVRQRIQQDLPSASLG